MSFEKPAVVIDNGSFNIKAGFACDNHPVSMFRTLVGRPNNLKGGYGREYYDVYIGDEAAAKVMDLEVNHPVVRGNIEHWDNMERIWHNLFYRELKVAPEDRAVILACGATSTMEEKIKCCEVFFETLNCPALCIQPQPVLSMYGTGTTTGICVDIGYDTTDIVPIFEGGMVKYAHVQTGIAGSQVSKYLKKSLGQRDLLEIHLSFEDIEDIKKQYLYATPNSAMSIHKKIYKLPSGEEIDVSNEAFMAAELIFQPDLLDDNGKKRISLQDAVVTAASKCDEELRLELYNAIVSCGGMSTVPGINGRLQMEIQNKIKKSVTILTSSEPYAVAWLGGATFAGLSDAKKLWIQKKQFEDYGEKIVKNKFM
ncbi:actin-1-like [Maniola jurtina]|uniref:actin-1-like n=1 Tax=Maniola jurtina TaxID=191418 RepID=UPI001E68DB13|nr:actin-1-like [Maniola jurtina]